MVDLHTHTVFSDGQLLPFELARRAEAAGYTALAITDHVDPSNMDFAIPRLAASLAKLKGKLSLDLIAGAELTHVPPSLIVELVAEARKLGAALVVVHGETLAEPVAPGTNRAAIEAGADILAHPGLISEADARLAAERGVALEITARKGHSISNGHVARMALLAGAQMVIDTDAHGPEDLISLDQALRVLMGAGLDREQAGAVIAYNRSLADKALRRVCT